MTFGQLAGLIAAIAFLILVIFACILLNQLSKTMKETNKSIFKFAGKTLVLDAFNKFRQHRKQKKGMTNNE